MGCFYGKVKKKKGKTEEKIKKILLGNDPEYINYEDQESKKIKFDPHYKLDKNEIFYLECDQKVKKLINNKEILEITDKNTTIYDEITSDDWGHLDFLVYSKNNILYYQRIIGKKYLTKKMFLGFDTGNPTLRNEAEGVEINKNPDFIYNKTNNKIYFKDFSRINKILSGIDELYREATTTEITSFLDSDLIQNKDIDLNEISVPKRKKIAQAIDKLETMEKSSLIAYGQKYHSEIFEGDKIIVNEIKDIDTALKIIFEKFYTSEVTKEKREANSVRTI